MKKILELAKTLLFLYLILSFYEWNFNPGEWESSSRTALVIIFGIIIF
ncbi:hypothetical protein [Flavobacterium commune]|nr:hypothetical protein [Flavobacterium commune]